MNSAGVVVQSTSADGVGSFRFDRVPAGQYQVRAQFEGFRPSSTRVRVTTRAPGAQKLVLGIAGLTQEITVSNAADVGATAASNVDAVSLDQTAREPAGVRQRLHRHDVALPRYRITRHGGVTLVVNGMEVNALNVSASAVQQIRINQDPYSAEYSRPGRGRVEILTKPGAQRYHGDLN